MSGYWDAPQLPSNGTALQDCEDSVLYRDARGDFHMLFHYFGLKEDHGDHGGHAHAPASFALCICACVQTSHGPLHVV